MGLITNGHRNGFSPFRWMSGNLISIQNGAAIRNNYLPGKIHNWSWHATRQTALPQGSLHPNGWMLPRTGGGMSMRITASGTLSASMISELLMAVDFTGSGDLNAEAQLTVSMLCAMMGNGTLTADIVGLLNTSVDFTGSGDLSANIKGIGQIVVDMLGSGDLEATIAAYGNMSIDIVVTGTGLTTANVGNAVWSALAASNNEPDTMGEKLNDAGSAANPWTELIEGTYTAADVLRLLSAVAAGKTTIVDLGGGSATVTFRDINDTVDRVEAEMLNSERINVTKNL